MSNDELLGINSENEFATISPELLPKEFSDRIDALEMVNKSYEKALEKKKQAQSKVNEAYARAKALIENAKELGKLEKNTHKFLNFEWSTNKDCIVWLEDCIETISRHGGETAELELATVTAQTALLASQKAVMNVQKRQMEYMQKTTDMMKFLYGLSAYSIASTQSIVTNLELILSGAKKKDLGEMARQQMFLVMDQLKSQENIKISLDKNRKRIDALEKDVDRRLDEGEARDRRQNEALRSQMRKDEEHDKAILAGIEKDEEQDAIIAQQMIKDEEHDRLLEERVKKDANQDESIEHNRERLEILETKVLQLEEMRLNARIVYLSIILAGLGVVMGIINLVM